MTDVLVPVLIPYTRFLEVRARRLQIVAELAQSTPDRPIKVAVSSEPTPNEQGAGAAMHPVLTAPTAGIQR